MTNHNATSQEGWFACAYMCNYISMVSLYNMCLFPNMQGLWGKYQRIILYLHIGFFFKLFFLAIGPLILTVSHFKTQWNTMQINKNAP